MARQIRCLDARIPVIFVTMIRADAAIEDHGWNSDYLFKPLLSPIRRVVGGPGRGPYRAAYDPGTDVEGACVGISSCPAMRESPWAIGRSPVGNVTVLITGEISQSTQRRPARFGGTNCASENL